MLTKDQQAMLARSATLREYRQRFGDNLLEVMLYVHTITNDAFECVESDAAHALAWLDHHDAHKDELPDQGI